MIRPIVHCERGECYIGSTTKTLAKRFGQHKRQHDCSSKHLFERYSADRLEIIELETCGEFERLICERRHIDNTHCLNKYIPFRSEEEAIELHRERFRKYREENPEKIKESNRKYHEENLEKIKESNRKYQQAHPEENRERARKWREDNPQKYEEQKKRARELRKLKNLAEKSNHNV